MRKNGGFHGIQTLESPKVEGLVKKRGNSRKSNTRDSGTRGICEKNGGFQGVRTLETPKVEGFVKKREIHGIQTLEILKVEDFLSKRLHFHVFEAYGWPLLTLKLMDAPFALWGCP